MFNLSYDAFGPDYSIVIQEDYKVIDKQNIILNQTEDTKCVNSIESGFLLSFYLKNKNVNFFV